MTKQLLAHDELETFSTCTVDLV